MEEVLLASASVRRAAILKERGFVVIQQALKGKERPHRHGLSIGEQVEHILAGKVEAALRELEHPCIVVADTLVEDPDDRFRPLGQPQTPAEALSMLLRLESRNHRVWSGTALLLEGEIQSWVTSATVSVGTLDEDVLEALIQTGSWRGKAGGYDLAGPMAQHAELIDGVEETVLGFAPELFAALGNA